MDGFFSALSASLVLLMLMSVGYFMGRLGWMTAAEKRFLSKFIVNIAVPCNCVTGLLNNLDHDSLLQAGVMVASAMVGVAVTLALCLLLAKLLRLPRERWGVFVAMAAFSNTLFIGLPVSTQLFGDVCVPYVMMYYLANTLFVQSAGILLNSSYRLDVQTDQIFRSTDFLHRHDSRIFISPCVVSIVHFAQFVHGYVFALIARCAHCTQAVVFDGIGIVHRIPRQHAVQLHIVYSIPLETVVVLRVSHGKCDLNPHHGKDMPESQLDQRIDIAQGHGMMGKQQISRPKLKFSGLVGIDFRKRLEYHGIAHRLENVCSGCGNHVLPLESSVIIYFRFRIGCLPLVFHHS